jgi:hypothetical protein
VTAQSSDRAERHDPLMNRPLSLLLLEDDPRLAELVRHVLADSAPEFEVEHVAGLGPPLPGWCGNRSI